VRSPGNKNKEFGGRARFWKMKKNISGVRKKTDWFAKIRGHAGKIATKDTPAVPTKATGSPNCSVVQHGRKMAGKKWWKNSFEPFFSKSLGSIFE
jgi:hypothetical protein